jgi:two-component system OmpR family response regulator
MPAEDSFLILNTPTPNRPLMGLTVLLVEDSRYASEAMRLLCQRSGARLRRADTIAHARLHLRTYRPGVVIVDMGLPDGSGADLIAELNGAHPRVDVILGFSGDPSTEEAARAAGADDFLAKPIGSISYFQNKLLSLLPMRRRPKGLREIVNDKIQPDRLTLREDLATIREALGDVEGNGGAGYAAQFAASLAHDLGDRTLEDAADGFLAVLREGLPEAPAAKRLSAMIHDRIAATPSF